ncbi:hypothetical protein CY652_22270 [Burkholderia sp. WAC0059]|uniref:DUF3318 domain-containing protein n=1 Tax=Burkholderia sp. WAC0059 TaxID=2066022 RepID=UPI000C7F1603|nr:DUF3318 domain-containing protein [Burkholderia sp. WAC0059]PLZ00176.1 hypothetical protein CY652_22270 [Burkholderia sp. WAC0059]
MSHPKPDTVFRPRRPPAKELTTPQLRALRKELLVLRADVERAELSEALIDFREAVSKFSWLRLLLPAIGGLRAGSKTAGLGALLKQYPLLSSLASLLLAKPLGTGLISRAKPILKWAGLALTAWEGYRIWRQIRQESETPDGESAGDDGSG